MRRLLALVWLAVGCAILTAGAQAATAALRPGVAGGVYTDSIRESNVALDISTVTVANDASGLISFGVEFASRAAGLRLGGNDLVVVGLDSDSDPATGTGNLGLDYAIDLDRDALSLLRWDSTRSSFIRAPARTLTSDWDATALTFRIDAKELGVTEAFRFRVLTLAHEVGQRIDSDVAPDRGLWAHDLKLPARLAVGGISCVPEPGIRGGKLFANAFARITRGETVATLPSETVVRWRATFGGVRLTPLGTRVVIDPAGLRGATAYSFLQATWKLPRTIRAKFVRVTIVVSADGMHASRTHLHRVA
jgi:hypothetical protein